jgi:hypothetical protein
MASDKLDDVEFWSSHTVTSKPYPRKLAFTFSDRSGSSREFLALTAQFKFDHDKNCSVEQRYK